MARTIAPPRVAPYWPTPTQVTERRFTVHADLETTLVALSRDATKNGVTMFSFDGTPANFLTGRGNNRVHGRIDLAPAPGGQTRLQLRIRPLGRVLGSTAPTSGAGEQYHLVCWQMRILEDAATLVLSAAQRKSAQLSFGRAAESDPSLPFPFSIETPGDGVNQQAVVGKNVTAASLMEAFREQASMAGVSTMPTGSGSELAWMVGDSTKKTLGTFQALPMTGGARVWLTWDVRHSSARTEPINSGTGNAPASPDGMGQFVESLVSHAKLLAAPLDGLSL